MTTEIDIADMHSNGVVRADEMESAARAKDVATDTRAPLLPGHIELLRERAVPIEAALIAGLHSVTADEAGKLLGWGAPALPGIAIVYAGIEPTYARLRVDSGPIRYLVPKGREVPVYVPSSIIEAPELDGELAEALVVTEGPIKALALRSVGLHAVALGGVATCLTKDHRRLNGSWDRLALKGQQVIVCLDGNRRSKPAVALAEARLVIALEIAGAEVRVADLPEGPRGQEGWGPDDYLAAQGADALLDVLKRAVPGNPLKRIRALEESGDTEAAEMLLDDGPFLAAVLEGGERVRSTAARRLAEKLKVGKQAFGRALTKYERDAKTRDEDEQAPCEVPYTIEDGRFVFIDTKFPRPVCNFTAQIVEDVTVDDGSDTELREFIVEGETADKHKLSRVTVPAGEFSAASAHWPSIRWGHTAIVNAECQQHVRPAILYNSPKAERRRVLAHTGFRVIDGSLVYLTQSGAIGAAVNAQVRLDSTLQRYALPAEPVPVEQVVEGIRTLLRLRLIAPDRTVIPLIAAGFRAPLCHWLPCDCVLWVVGPTGSLKSTLVAIPLGLFGAGFDREHLPANWGDTQASLETKCFRAKDAVIVIDDYAPKDERDDQRKKVDRTVRDLGNGASRSRMRSDMTARPDRPPRGVVIVTGEDLPQGQSIVARLMPIQQRRQDVDLLALTELQRQAHLLPGVMRAYVTQVIAWAAADPAFGASLRKRFEDLRSSFRSTGHLRAPAAAANMALGWRAFVNFACGIGAVTQGEADELKVQGDEAMRTQLEAQHAVSTQDEPVEKFLRWLRDLVASRRVRLVDVDEPITQLPGSETIGWSLPDGTAHLLPEATYAAVVQAMHDAREPFMTSGRTLWGRMRERGFVRGSDEDRHTVQRRHGGQKQRVIELLPHALNPDGDDDPPGGWVSPVAVPGVPGSGAAEKATQHAVPHGESTAVPGVPGFSGVGGATRDDLCVSVLDDPHGKNAIRETSTPGTPGTPGTEEEEDRKSSVVSACYPTPGPSPVVSPVAGNRGHEPGTLVTDPGSLAELARAIESAGVVGLDIETTGLDPRRDRPRLLQLALPDGRVAVIDLFATAGCGPLAEALSKIEGVVGHNLAFDLGFLRHHFGITPQACIDTMLAAQIVDGGVNLHAKGYFKLDAVTDRVLGVRLDKTLQVSDWSGALAPSQIAYAAADVAHLLPLWDALDAKLADRSLTATRDIECDLVPAIVGMELAGVPVDLAALDALVVERAALSVEARRRVEATLHIGNANSPKQLLPALQALGLNVTASNAEALAPFRDHPVVRDLQAMRTEKKTADDARSLAEVARLQVDGRVRPSWWQIGAPTGRMATSGPNMLGLPKDPGMRACIAAPPGRMFIVADYAAIELRVLAHVTRDKRLTSIFRAGGDPHRALAALLLNKTADEVTGEERKRVKPVNFGFCFGMGTDRFVAYALKDYGVVFTTDEARKFKRAYLDAYRQVDEWQQRTRGTMARGARTVAGRVRDFANSSDGYTDRLNLPIQGTAADGMKRAMALLAPRLARLDAQMVLAVHDELVVEAPEAAADEVKTVVRDGMVEGMAVDVTSVPILVEAGVRGTWAGAS